SAFARMKETVDAIMDLIRYAKELHQHAGDLILAISRDAPVTERSKYADEVERLTNLFIASARKVINGVSDPTLKRVIENSIVSVESALKDLVRIGRLPTISAADQRQAADAFEKL